MKKIIALIAIIMALAIGASVIAIAEQANTEAAAEVVAEEAAVVAEEPAATAEPAAIAEPAATAEPTVVPAPTEAPHVHTWSVNYRECTGCGEAYPCWNDEEKTFVHDFTDSEFCLVCEAALYCGVEGHEKTAKHAMGECGVPGHFVCDELEHDRVYGKGFDYEGHTACLEEVEHTCEDCGRTYTCEFSNSHVKCIKCENMWCYKAEGDHTENSCGHRHCEIHGNYKKHAKCEFCGEYLCNGRSHSSCVPAVNAPSDDPSSVPSDDPSSVPSDDPSSVPSDDPSSAPSDDPSSNPSDDPSSAPSDDPTGEPADVQG